MGIPIGTGLGQGVYHPESGKISNPPPKPPPQQTPAAALAEHIAVQTGQNPAMVAPGVSPELEPTYPGPASGLAAMYQPGQINPLYSSINRYLRKKQSPLAGLGQVFVNQGKAAGIDPRLLVAITGAETSFMTDPNAAPMSEHNAFGMGPGIQYPTWRAGIHAAAQNLGQNYFGEGLNTIPEISAKWAPPGASNDPNAVNQNWSGNVSKFYNELGGERPSLPSIPKWAGAQELIYDPRGSWFRGQGNQINPEPYGGHETHIHEAFTNPRAMLRSYRVGTKHGLTFGENPYTSGVNPVHTDQSFHYNTFPGTFGPDDKKLGQAWDITDPNPNSGWDLNRMFQFLARRVTGSPAFDYGNAGGGAYDVTGPATPSQASTVASRDAASNALIGGSLASFQDVPGLGRGRRRRKSAVDDLLANLQNIQTGGSYLGAT